MYIYIVLDRDRDMDKEADRQMDRTMVLDGDRDTENLYYVRGCIGHSAGHKETKDPDNNPLSN